MQIHNKLHLLVKFNCCLCRGMQGRTHCSEHLVLAAWHIGNAHSILAGGVCVAADRHMQQSR